MRAAPERGRDVTYPQQPGGQLPVCANGHPITTFDSTCPLCGAGLQDPAAGSGFPAPPAGFPSPAAGGSAFPPGGYSAGGYQAQAAGAPAGPGYQAPGAAGYQARAAGYPASGGPGYWQQAYLPAPKTNVLAIISLIAGILWFFWLGSIVALVCGLLALGQIRTRGEAGRGIAIAGIVLAGLGLLTLAGTIIAAVILAHRIHPQPYPLPTGGAR